MLRIFKLHEQTRHNLKGAPYVHTPGPDVVRAEGGHQSQLFDFILLYHAFGKACSHLRPGHICKPRQCCSYDRTHIKRKRRNRQSNVVTKMLGLHTSAHGVFTVDQHFLCRSPLAQPQIFCSSRLSQSCFQSHNLVHYLLLPWNMELSERGVILGDSHPAISARTVINIF